MAVRPHSCTMSCLLVPSLVVTPANSQAVAAVGQYLAILIHGKFD